MGAKLADAFVAAINRIQGWQAEKTSAGILITDPQGTIVRSGVSDSDLSKLKTFLNELVNTWVFDGVTGNPDAAFLDDDTGLYVFSDGTFSRIGPPIPESAQPYDIIRFAEASDATRDANLVEADGVAVWYDSESAASFTPLDPFTDPRQPPTNPSTGQPDFNNFRWDGNQWVSKAPEVADGQEQFLGTVEEDGWSIDQYGTADGVITRRQVREPIQPPEVTIQQQIDRLLIDAVTLDMSDENYARAIGLNNFKNAPTDAERLQLAMQLAQSPSDYLTLVGLYTGAISKETTDVGARIAPLAPFLQDAARKFFIDIPGLTRPFDSEIAEDQALEDEIINRPGDPTVPSDVQEGLDDGTGLRGIGDGRELPNQGAILQERVRQSDAELASQVDPSTTTVPGGQVGRPLTDAEAEEEELGVGRKAPSLVTPDAVIADKSIDADKTQRILNILNPPKDSEGKKAPSPRLVPTDEEEGLEFHSGGIVPGRPGQEVNAVLEAGERVIPRGGVVRHSGTAPDIFGGEGFFGDVFRVPRTELPGVLAAPSKVQIPSLTGIPFRSAQTRRGQSPTARSLFRSLVEQSGVPIEDFLQQEERATSVGGQRRQRARFGRTPSLVR